MQHISDEELLLMLEDDVENGIRLAIDMYGRAVKKICTVILSGYSKQDIEETVSDCFVALWQGTSRFDEEKNCSLKSYLYGIARRTASNKKRRLAKDKSVHMDDEVVLNIEDKRAERELDSLLDMNIVDDLIQHMDSVNRDIFICRYYQEMPIKDIAERLNMTVKSIEGRLLRGKKILQGQLIANGICK